MSCQKLSRRYLHLVLGEEGGMYSLRHMDMSKLFYPSTGEVLDAEAQGKMKASVSYKEVPPIAYTEHSLPIISAD